jgi:hypothetical protein
MRQEIDDEIDGWIDRPDRCPRRALALWLSSDRVVGKEARACPRDCGYQQHADRAAHADGSQSRTHQNAALPPKMR